MSLGIDRPSSPVLAFFPLQSLQLMGEICSISIKTRLHFQLRWGEKKWYNVTTNREIPKQHWYQLDKGCSGVNCSYTGRIAYDLLRQTVFHGSKDAVNLPGIGPPPSKKKKSCVLMKSSPLLKRLYNVYFWLFLFQRVK